MAVTDELIPTTVLFGDPRIGILFRPYELAHQQVS
jgi:hypothetical protein